MSRRTRIASLVAVAFVAASATAAYGVQSTANAAKQKTFTIDFVSPVAAAPGLKLWRDGVAQESKKLGMKFVEAGGQFDVNAQIAALNSLIARGVDAIVTSPIDPNGTIPVFVKAQKKGIKVLTYASYTKGVDAGFVSDEHGAAMQIVARAAQQLKAEGKPCNAGVIMGTPTAPVLKKTNQGYLDGIKAANCKLLDKQIDTKNSLDASAAIALLWKVKYAGDMTVIFGYDDTAAMGALAAVGDEFAPLVTGIVGTPEGVRQVKEGTSRMTP
jgi:ribose transport system substrate-binding protein